MATLAIAISEEVLTNGKLMYKRSETGERAHLRVFVASRQKTNVFANGGGCGAKEAATLSLPILFGESARLKPRAEMTAHTATHRANRSIRVRGGNSRMRDLSNSRIGIPVRNGLRSKDPATMCTCNDCGIDSEASPVRSMANAGSSLFRRNRGQTAR
jgi:hypothetical protein